MNPKFLLEFSFLRGVLLKYYLHFSSKLIKNANGKYIVDEKKVYSQKHNIEQVIFSGAFVLYLLKEDLRFIRNRNKIEKDLLEAIKSIIEQEGLIEVYDADDMSPHDFMHFRFFQYKILLDKQFINPGIYTSKLIINYLYLNPTKFEFSDSAFSLDCNDDLYNLLTIMFNTSCELFAFDFLDSVKLTEDEKKTMLNFFYKI